MLYLGSCLCTNSCQSQVILSIFNSKYNFSYSLCILIDRSHLLKAFFRMSVTFILYIDIDGLGSRKSGGQLLYMYRENEHDKPTTSETRKAAKAGTGFHKL